MCVRGRREVWKPWLLALPAHYSRAKSAQQLTAHADREAAVALQDGDARESIGEIGRHGPSVNQFLNQVSG
jgi:hypothetical protein